MRNVGNVDRAARVVAAVVLAVGGFAASGVLAVILWVLAAVMAVTAAVGFCPLYRLLGIDTCRIGGDRTRGA